VRTSFVLIRHAESPWSEDDARSLSPDGRLAAEALADRLDGIALDAIYSSPYRRALQTVAPLAQRRGLDVQELFDIRERTLGAFPGESFEDALAATWSQFDLCYTGGESSRAAQQRGLEVIRALAGRHRSQTVALSTHGNLLALLLNVFDPRVDFAFWRSLTFPDVFELQVSPTGQGVFCRIGQP
jgi:broad specificity phosphatase PhoE